MEKETISVIAEDLLSKAVKTSKDVLSRQTRVLVKQAIPEGAGNLKKFEVLNGVCFIDVDTQAAADAIIAKFKTVKGVSAESVTPIQAIFRKSKMRDELEKAEAAAAALKAKSETKAA